MHPGFKLTLIGDAGDGRDATRTDISKAINSRLLELIVQDEVGVHNDRLTIHLDDRQPYIALPFQGERLEVQLGYLKVQNNVQPAPMRTLGTFVIDELEIVKERGGRELLITAHAWDTESTLKQPRTTHYHEVNLGDIITYIAFRSNAQPVIEETIGQVHVAHIDQVATSDITFLDVLSQRFGADYKILDGKIYFATAGQLAQLTAGSDGTVILATFTMDDADVLSFHFLTQGKGRYTAIRAKFLDKDTGVMQYVETPHDDPSDPDAKNARVEVFYEIPETFADKDAALSAALAKKQSFDKSQASLKFTTIGTPQLMSDCEVELTNFRPEVPPNWKLQKVTHRISKSGYISECEAQTNLPHRIKRVNYNKLKPIR